MFKKSFVSLISLMIMFMMLTFTTGCVSTGTTTTTSTTSTITSNPIVDNTYKILKTAYVVYDNGMKTVATLYESGRISIEDKDKVIVVAKKFVVSYKFLVKSLEMYVEGTLTQLTVDKAVEDFIVVQVEFAELVRELVQIGS